MKTSSDNQNPPPAAKLWACILCNQLAFPGLGTIMAGRRIGYVQAAIMVVGFVLFTGFMVWYFICLARYMASMTMDQAEFRAQYHSYLWAAKYGLTLCVVAWCWALFSSLALLRRSQKTSPA
jgi:hypothetical protein